MKAKKVIAVLCSTVMLWSMPIFAQEQNVTWQYTQAPQYVTKEV